MSSKIISYESADSIESFVKIANDMGLGTGDGKNVELTDISEAELIDGVTTESNEHNVDIEEAIDIAMDHEAETIDILGEPVYYEYLSDMEDLIKQDAEKV